MFYNCIKPENEYIFLFLSFLYLSYAYVFFNIFYKKKYNLNV